MSDKHMVNSLFTQKLVVQQTCINCRAFEDNRSEEGSSKFINRDASINSLGLWHPDKCHVNCKENITESSRHVHLYVPVIFWLVHFEFVSTKSCC
jgi:hypothetical protein